jgi:hypothetical protein
MITGRGSSEKSRRLVGGQKAGASVQRSEAGDANTQSASDLPSRPGTAEGV